MVTEIRGQKEILRDIEKLRAELRGLGETGIATVNTIVHGLIWGATYDQLCKDNNLMLLKVEVDKKMVMRYPQGFQVAFSRKDSHESAAKLVDAIVQKKIIAQKKSLENCKDRNLVL